jgi:Armadillo/beta-catenin-like repeat
MPAAWQCHGIMASVLLAAVLCWSWKSCGNGCKVQVIDVGGVPQFISALESPVDSLVKSAAWGVLHNVMHGQLIATKWAVGGIIPPLLEALLVRPADREAPATSSLHAAIKEVVKSCSLPNPLFTLVSELVPEDLATQAMSRLYSIMQESVVGRRDFVTTGTLLKLQQLEQCWGAPGADCVLAINSLFPRDVVMYYRQGLPGG